MAFLEILPSEIEPTKRRLGPYPRRYAPVVYLPIAKPKFVPKKETRPPIPKISLERLLAVKKPESGNVTASFVLGACSAFYGLSRDEILGQRRWDHFVRVRQVAMYLARIEGAKGLSSIGRSFQRDHTTIMHAVRRIPYLMETDADLRWEVETLQGFIRSIGPSVDNSVNGVAGIHTGAQTSLQTSELG